MAFKLSSCEFVGSFYELKQLPRDRRPQVALAGRSNVGKSTLLNKVVGHRKMAKVSSTPGKTRALNFFLVNDRFYLVDLPGYGYAKASKKEQQAWNRLTQEYLDAGRFLAGLVLLLDCRREPNAEDERMIAWLAEKQLPALAVVTKSDKLSRNQVNRKVQDLENAYQLAAIPFSAVSGQGRGELMAALGQLIDGYRERVN